MYKLVEEFKVGDGIILYGWKGTVVEIDRQKRKVGDCTYLRVKFDDPASVGYQYENGWYGGLNGAVAYGHFER